MAINTPNGATNGNSPTKGISMLGLLNVFEFSINTSEAMPQMPQFLTLASQKNSSALNGILPATKSINTKKVLGV